MLACAIENALNICNIIFIIKNYNIYIIVDYRYIDTHIVDIT